MRSATITLLVLFAVACHFEVPGLRPLGQPAHGDDGASGDGPKGDGSDGSDDQALPSDSTVSPADDVSFPPDLHPPAPDLRQPPDLYQPSCGTLNKPCCNGQCNQPQTTCVSLAGVLDSCQACGDGTTLCCNAKGNYCGFGQVCEGGQCDDCGKMGQPCCPVVPCNWPAQCKNGQCMK